MTLACLLAIAAVLREDPVPHPVATNSAPRVKRSGNSGLDSFALKVIDCVRNDDWRKFVTLAGPKVIFETYEQPQNLGQEVLFDDTLPIAETPVFTFTCKRLAIDTRKPPSSFASDEFSYFSTLVDECVTGEDSSARCETSMLRPDRGSRAPTIWGKVATNATWRIELARSADKWRVNRLVIEYH